MKSFATRGESKDAPSDERTRLDGVVLRANSAYNLLQRLPHDETALHMLRSGFQEYTIQSLIEVPLAMDRRLLSKYTVSCKSALISVYTSLSDAYQKGF